MKRSTIFIGMLLSAASVMAQTETAKTLYKEATADRSKMEQFLKRDFTTVDSTSIHDLAVMLYRDKDYRSAGRCWEIALQKVKKHGKAYEQILTAMSSAYTELDDKNKIQMVMELMEEHNQHELTLPCNDYKCKLERAQYYIMHGDESKGREYIQESLKLCLTEEQHIEVEEAYAKILFDVRDFLSCAQYYLSASNRWKKLGTNPVHMGTDMYWAAQNYMLASQYDKAETCSRDAIACFKRQKDETEKKFYLMGILSLGDALFCQQKYQEALDTYQIELDGYSAWKPKSEKHADALEDMAKVEVRLKKFEDAKKHYQAALDIYKTLKLDTKYSNTYSSLMVCLRKAGDNDTADKMEQDAENKRKAVYQRLLNDELPSLETTRKYLGSMTYTNSLNTIAGCYFGVNNYIKAAEYYSLYANNLRNMLRERFVLMTEKDRGRVWKEQQQHIDDFCYDIATLPDTATAKMQSFIPTFYNLELLSKGIMLNSSIEFEKVLGSMADKSLKETWQQIEVNQQEIERLQTEASDENLQKVLALKEQNIPLEQKLMKSCREVKDYTEYLLYTWQDVQQHLNDDDIAIEFSMVQLSPLDKDTYLLALILNKTGQPMMEVVSTRAIIKNLANKEDLYDNAAYNNFFWGGSLRKHLDGKKRIFFAPNNMLSNVAVEYLKDGDKPFSEKHEVYRVSSTKELCKEYHVSTSRILSVFGDIDYETAKVAKDRVGFGQLKYSRPEIEAVEKAMKKQYKVKVYDGAKATEYAFRRLSDRSPAILHISSHGEYKGDNKTNEDEAMEMSVLALAGSNQTDKSQDEDGYVSAADVASMNLRQCDMAVLSACYTGIGGQGTDGIFGLQRGFKNAGVHTLLMSLKYVSDEATYELMKCFYKGLVNGLSKREALVKAQRYLREHDFGKGKDFSKGEKWAPFILLDAFDTK